jgi:hypothetical protein
MRHMRVACQPHIDKRLAANRPLVEEAEFLFPPPPSPQMEDPAPMEMDNPPGGDAAGVEFDGEGGSSEGEGGSSNGEGGSSDDEDESSDTQSTQAETTTPTDNQPTPEATATATATVTVHEDVDEDLFLHEHEMASEGYEWGLSDEDEIPYPDDHEEDDLPAGQPIPTTSDTGRRTAQWFIERKDWLLYNGAKLTVQQASYALLRTKLEDHLTDKYLDNHCKWLSVVVLPQPNFLPPSLHLLKKVCEVKEAEEFEKHVCVNDCVKFPDLRPSHYPTHLNEKCPKCQEPRFKGKDTNKGVKLVPRKVFWEVGVGEAITSLFANPEWAGMRGKTRDRYVLDYYSSEEAKRVNAATNKALDLPDNSAYDVGFDFFQCFHFKQHSVGIVGMR